MDHSDLLSVSAFQAAVYLQEYSAIDRALLSGKISDPVAAKNVLQESAENIPEVATIYVRFCDSLSYLEDLVKHYLTRHSFPEIKQLIERVGWVIHSPEIKRNGSINNNCFPTLAIITRGRSSHLSRTSESHGSRCSVRSIRGLAGRIELHARLFEHFCRRREV